MGLADKCGLLRVFSLGRMVVAAPSDRKGRRSRRARQPMARTAATVWATKEREPPAEAQRLSRAQLVAPPAADLLLPRET